MWNPEPGRIPDRDRAHVIAWRKELDAGGAAASTVRRKLSAISSLFDFLCDANAITHNPVNGVSRPKEKANEGQTPALSDGQAAILLDAPPTESIKGIRDRAILSTLLYHGLRRDELCGLKVSDFQERRGMMHFRIKGKGSKIRYVVAHPLTIEHVLEYLEAVGHKEDFDGPLFRPVRNNRTGELRKHRCPGAVYRTWEPQRLWKLLTKRQIELIRVRGPKSM